MPHGWVNPGDRKTQVPHEWVNPGPGGALAFFLPLCAGFRVGVVIRVTNTKERKHRCHMSG